MKNSLNRFIAGIACTILIAGLSVPAHAAEAQPEPYTIQTTQWSREDFSKDANPDVFTATYDCGSFVAKWYIAVVRKAVETPN